MDKERFYTVKEVANLLDISEERVRQFIRSGELKAFITSRHKGYRILSSQLDEFLTKKETEGLEPKKRGRKPKEVAVCENTLVEYERPVIPVATNNRVLLCWASDARANGLKTALLVDVVERAFVFDRSWDVTKHREDLIIMFSSTLENINDLADNFESAGFKELGRGFFE